MTDETDSFDESVVATLQTGGVVVMRTDTIYGLLARADSQTAVERVYAIKQRTPSKSPIVLVSSLDQLFDVYDRVTLAQLDALWPDKVSVILPSQAAPDWLRRGNQSVAYRMPAHQALRALVEQTGPLIAPSANPEGQPPAETIEQAKQYFGNLVDVYVDGSIVIDTAPSRLYRLYDGSMERLR